MLCILLAFVIKDLINVLEVFVASLYALLVILSNCDPLCLCLTLYFQGTSCPPDITQAGSSDRQTHLQAI